MQQRTHVHHEELHASINYPMASDVNRLSLNISTGRSRGGVSGGRHKPVALNTITHVASVLSSAELPNNC